MRLVNRALSWLRSRLTRRQDDGLLLVADHVAVDPSSGEVFLRRTTADDFQFAAVDFYTEVCLEGTVYVFSPLAVCVLGPDSRRLVRLAEHPVFGLFPLQP